MVSRVLPVIPDIILPYLTSGPAQSSADQSLHSVFLGQKTLLLAHPGAFTYYTTWMMLPQYQTFMPRLKAKGFTQFLAMSINDKHVLMHYLEKYRYQFNMLSDWDGKLTTALGLLIDHPAYFGRVSKRAVLIVDEQGLVRDVSCEDDVSFTEMTKPGQAMDMYNRVFPQSS